jgi:menaquinone-9 beta-reductase
MFDVIVVGGGPAGSTAAGILARGGCSVLLLDRAAFPRHKACGDYLNPGCAAILARLGLRDTVAATDARPVAGMRVVTSSGGAVTLPFAGGAGWAVPRRILDHALLAHAADAGTRVEEQTRVTSIAHERGEVRITAEGPHGRRVSYTGGLVIGADGLHSTIARLAGAGGPPRRGRFTVGTYVQGLVPERPLDGGDVGEIHLHRDYYCGVAYLPGGLANVTLALRRERLRTWGGSLEVGYWATLRTFPQLAGRIDRARRAGAFATSGPLAYWRRGVVRGRVLLAGDAAAYIDPLTGQGLFLALRGAEMAAAAARRALDHGEAAAAAFRQYQRARRHEFAQVFLISRILQCLAFRPGVVRRAVERVQARPELGRRLIGAVGNIEPPGALLHPGFVASVLGLAWHAY